MGDGATDPDEPRSASVSDLCSFASFAGSFTTVDPDRFSRVALSTRVWSFCDRNERLNSDMANDGRRKITGRLKVGASFTGLDAAEREKTKEKRRFSAAEQEKKKKESLAFFLINSSTKKTVEFFVVLEASDKRRERAKSETSESGKEKERRGGKRREEKRGGN